MYYLLQMNKVGVLFKKKQALIDIKDAMDYTFYLSRHTNGQPVPVKIATSSSTTNSPFSIMFCNHHREASRLVLVCVNMGDLVPGYNPVKSRSDFKNSMSLIQHKYMHLPWAHLVARIWANQARAGLIRPVWLACIHCSACTA
jgi:hypothetical protein